MKKIVSMALCFAMLFSVSFIGRAEDGAEGMKEAVSQKAALLTGKYGATSVQYALMEKGKITLSGHSGVYSKTENRALTSDIMYGIGSTSKMFAAAAVMKLADEKKLDIDQPVKNYLPEFTMEDDRYIKITPRMLLNHSSGLMGSTFDKTFLFGESSTASHDQFLEQLKSQRLKAEPGAFSVYCNDGFTLAELLVEKVSGMDFTTYIHENFTNPLNMKNTKTPQDAFDRKQLARAYDAKNPMLELPNDTVNVIGTGGIYSTAEDMCRFGQIFTGEEKILSETALKAMEAKEYENGIWPEAKENTLGYGLGWDSVALYPYSDYGIQAEAKGGDTLIFHASMTVLPEQDIVAVVLSSGGASTYNQLLGDEMILSALEKNGTIKERLPEKTFEAPVAKPVDKEAMEKLAGLYGSNAALKDVRCNEEGQLVLAMALMPAQKDVYTHIGDNVFAKVIGEKSRILMSFEKAKNGEIYLKQEVMSVVPGLGQTAVVHYSAQKLPQNQLSDEIKEAWDKRNGKLYLNVTEKYNSQALYQALPMAGIATGGLSEGYLASNKITGPDTALAVVQIPGSAGRDLTDIAFYTENNVEYAKIGAYIYMSQDNVPNIYAGGEAICTILENGYIRWLTVGEDAAGKTMKVEIPNECGFIIYDKNGQCVSNSVVDKKTEVKLPEGGFIAFAGKTGSVFPITMQD